MDLQVFGFPSRVPLLTENDQAGGQAEYTRVPYGDVNLLKLPDSVPDEKGLYLSDVLCTSWNCVVDTRIDDGDVVAIWGAGENLHFVTPRENLF